MIRGCDDLDDDTVIADWACACLFVFVFDGADSCSFVESLGVVVADVLFAD